MSSITINKHCKVQRTPIYGSTIPLIVVSYKLLCGQFYKICDDADKV